MNEKFIFYINWLLGSKRTIRNLKYMGYQEKKNSVSKVRYNKFLSKFMQSQHQLSGVKQGL